jgi:DNA (cytosine-5)-methyltransferase 1
MSGQLVLSLFPGIGLLDRGFEAEGFCVVRGPDLVWGGDVHRFRALAGRFDGVIGGPPCQSFSGLANLMRIKGVEPAPNLIPEFERVVAEAQPVWWLMENVPTAPLPSVPGYEARPLLLNNRWIGEEQSRMRRFSFGTRDGRRLLPEVVALEAVGFAPTVTSCHAGERPRTKGRVRRYTVEEAADLQGLPLGELARFPFTRQAALKAIAEGVPVPMARTIARAIKRAMEGGALVEAAS